MTTVNSEDLRDSFHQAMRENPHDPDTRLIYADYLEEHGLPEEALHHRIIGQGLVRESWAHRMYSEAEMGHGGTSSKSITPFMNFIPSNLRRNPVTSPLYTYRRDKVTQSGFTRRLSTPLEASRAATRAGAGLMTQQNFPSVRWARNAEYNAEREARAGAHWEKRDKEAALGHYRGAAISHEISAEHHLNAADTLETRGTGRYRMVLARLHRRAALAHLYAAHVHRKALGEV